MAEFNSQDWFPLIEKLAATYYERSEKRFVAFERDSIALIRQAYPERLLSIKREVFDDPTANRIDRHKILALYIQLYLERPVFSLHNKESVPGPDLMTMLINESFCLDFMRIVLTEWTGKRFDVAKFKEYGKSFLKLLEYYKGHSEFHKRNLFFTYNFAHLIYFIERDFFA
jgi:hypothetical protein